MTEERFEDYNHPIDTDSDGIEHPLSESFALKHHCQQCTDMTNLQVIGDFTAAFSEANSAAIVKENLRAVLAKEVRWREAVLKANAKVEDMLAKSAGRSVDNAP